MNVPTVATARMIDPVQMFAEYLQGLFEGDDELEINAHVLIGIIVARSERAHLVFPFGIKDPPHLIVVFSDTQSKIVIAADTTGIYVQDGVSASSPGYHFNDDTEPATMFAILGRR